MGEYLEQAIDKEFDKITQRFLNPRAQNSGTGEQAISNGAKSQVDAKQNPSVLWLEDQLIKSVNKYKEPTNEYKGKYILVESLVR